MPERNTQTNSAHVGRKFNGNRILLRMSSDIPVESKGLKGGALGLLSSVVVGLASTAPAYSLAATLGLIVASGGALLAGVKAPAIVLISFIPMYLIAVAYQELNKAEPDCGTTFTWASRTFGPIVGWLGGWGIIAADVICLANLAQVAGAYSFTLSETSVGRRRRVWPTACCGPRSRASSGS